MYPVLLPYVYQYYFVHEDSHNSHDTYVQDTNTTVLVTHHSIVVAMRNSTLFSFNY